MRYRLQIRFTDDSLPEFQELPANEIEKREVLNSIAQKIEAIEGLDWKRAAHKIEEFLQEFEGNRWIDIIWEIDTSKIKDPNQAKKAIRKILGNKTWPETTEEILKKWGWKNPK